MTCGMEVLLPILMFLHALSPQAALLIYAVHWFDRPRLPPPVKKEEVEGAGEEDE